MHGEADARESGRLEWTLNDDDDDDDEVSIGLNVNINSASQYKSECPLC